MYVVGSDWETDEEDSNEMSALVESDDDGEGDRCPVCLNLLFRGQDIGTPESCDHNFCLLCIHEWSKVYNGLTIINSEI